MAVKPSTEKPAVSPEPERLTIGDEVIYRKKGHWLWKKGERHVISEITLVQGTIEYATNRGAWFERDDFTFLKPYSAESMKELEESDEDE